MEEGADRWCICSGLAVYRCCCGTRLYHVARRIWYHSLQILTIKHVADRPLDTRRGHTNLLRENTKVVMWCLIETSAALIGCCLPVLRPIFSDTWISRLLSRLRDRTSQIFPSPGPSERGLEEGIAFQSIGGTDLRVPSKRDSMSRKDSKMSTNVESHEADEMNQYPNSIEILDVSSKEISISKNLDVD